MNGYCEISIYYDCKILPNKNFKVDDLSSYLNTLTMWGGEPIHCQEMKHQLKHTYKVVLGERFLSFDDFSNLNYLKAQNFTKLTPSSTLTLAKVYYFIVGKKWLAQNCIELELEMDVINTMIDNTLNSGDPKLNLSTKSYILREHKNRWEKVGTNYRPLIDYMSEGINPLLFKKGETTYYYQKDGDYPDDRSFYLIYRSHSIDENSPIDIMCCSDYEIDTAQGIVGYSGTKDVKKVLGTDTWFIYGADGQGGQTNVGASISFTDKDGSHTLTINNSDQCIAISKSLIIFGTASANGLTTISAYSSGVFKNFRDVDFRRIYACRRTTAQLYYYAPEQTNPTFTSTYILNCQLDTSFDTTYQNFTICAIDDIDRTDPKLLKIVKLPYPPFKFNVVNHELIIPSGWEVRQAEVNAQQEVIFPAILLYSDSSLVNAFSIEFTPEYINQLYEPYQNPFTILSQRTISYFGNLGALRDSNMETKLLHSDFLKQKLVYDSFSYEIKGETLDLSVVDNSSCTLEFSITATMNSKMMFRIKDLISFNAYKSEVGDTQDYSGLLYIARNNELPVFNSAYLNYIRTGYNYDIKTKNRQLTSNIIGGVLSTAGAIASAVAGGPGIGMVGAIGLGIGAVSQFTKAIISTAQSEQNIAQKLKSTEMEGLSVAGSDDVDLMSIYTDSNKLKYVRYQVSDRMRNAIADLFHYCGYVANIYDNPLDRVNTRKWFNFVQCEPIYAYTQNFTQELIDKLTEKFNEGITFLHCNTLYVQHTAVKTWDFEQQYENWEVSV